MTNYNININRPPVSPEEIQRKKDFASLLKQHQAVHKPWFKKPWVAGTAGIAIVLGLVSCYFLLMDSLAKKHHEGEGLTIQSSKFKSNHEINTQNNNEALIKPALNNINVPFTSYSVNCSKATELNYKSGSVISIPANAFEDAQGNNISGKVNIRYREFHDPVDFMLSGIPMTYDSAGKQYVFESAGMIQIEGFKDGIPVKIKPDKKISVKMASRQKGNKYNLYSLDTVKGAWQCIGKDRIVYSNVANEGIAFAEIINTDQQSIFGNEISMINLPANARQYINGPIADKSKSECAPIDTTMIVNGLASQKPAKPQKADKKMKQFMLDVDTAEFPELSVYKNVKFQLVGDKAESYWTEPQNLTDKDEDDGAVKSKKDKKSSKNKTHKGKSSKVNINVLGGEQDTVKSDNNILSNIVWNDAKLSKGDLSYTLTLGAGSKRIVLPVTPVYDGKDYDNAVKEYNKKYEQYQAKLKERLDIEAEVQKEREKSLELARQDQQERYRQYQESRMDQIKRQDSLAMARNKWDNNGIQMNSQLYRCFEVGNFGVYNCDHGFDFPTRSSVITLCDENQQVYKCNNYYMLYLNRNAIMQFRPDAPVKYNPKGQNVLCAITSDGELVRASTDNFSEAKHKNKMTIQAESIGKKADVADIKSFIMPGK